MAKIRLALRAKTDPQRVHRGDKCVEMPLYVPWTISVSRFMFPLFSKTVNCIGFSKVSWFLAYQEGGTSSVAGWR